MSKEIHVTDGTQSFPRHQNYFTIKFKLFFYNVNIALLTKKYKYICKSKSQTSFKVKNLKLHWKLKNMRKSNFSTSFFIYRIFETNLHVKYQLNDDKNIPFFSKQSVDYFMEKILFIFFIFPSNPFQIESVTVNNRQKIITNGY